MAPPEEEEMGEEDDDGRVALPLPVVPPVGAPPAPTAGIRRV